MIDYSWLNKGALNYVPNQQSIKALKELIKGFKIIAVGGTWCGDTKELMPQFYKIIQSVNLSPENLEVYWLDRNKKGLYAEAELYRIEYVPTFIIYKGNEEVGRIVESLTKPSLEEELVSILEKLN
jgi:thiol-disulfide isomerase/thioredoxin